MAQRQAGIWSKEIVYPIHNNKFVRFWLDAPQHPINDALFTRYFTVRYQALQGSPTIWSIRARTGRNGCLPAKHGLCPRMDAGTDSYRRNIPGTDGTCQLAHTHQRYHFGTGRAQPLPLPFTDPESSEPNSGNRSAAGDSETQVTRLAEELHRVYGAETLIRILQAFGKDTFIRDSYNWRNTKQGSIEQPAPCLLPVSGRRQRYTQKPRQSGRHQPYTTGGRLPCSPRNGWNSPKKRPDGKDWKAPLTTSMPIPASVSTTRRKRSSPDIPRLP